MRSWLYWTSSAHFEHDFAYVLVVSHALVGGVGVGDGHHLVDDRTDRALLDLPPELLSETPNYLSFFFYGPGAKHGTDQAGALAHQLPDVHGCF